MMCYTNESGDMLQPLILAGTFQNGRSLKSDIVTNYFWTFHTAQKKVGNCVTVDNLIDRQEFTNCVTGPILMYKMYCWRREQGKGP